MNEKKRIKTYTIPHTKGFYEKYIKRPQDIILSSIALVTLSPVILVTALAVKVKLGSPVIFSQDRPGLNGKIFRMYKFRSMTNERDTDGKLLADEKRLTDFGKKLRKTSFDELPELINIVKGDMSIVGPRPLLPEYLSRYNEWQMRRHEVKPGLTGYAQVSGRNRLSWNKRFEDDVKYVDHISFLFDWKIILKTISIVIKKEGINSSTSSTMEVFMGNEK